MLARMLIGVAASLVLASVAEAQQYKWVDKDGRVQYGDTPPPGVKATPLRPPPRPATRSESPAAKDAAKAPLTPAEQELEFRRRAKEAQEAAAKAAQEKERSEAQKQNCASAQEALRALESGQRIVRTDAAGERYYLEDDQRAQETARAREAVGQWCK